MHIRLTTSLKSTLRTEMNELYNFCSRNPRITVKPSWFQGVSQTLLCYIFTSQDLGQHTQAGCAGDAGLQSCNYLPGLCARPGGERNDDLVYKRGLSGQRHLLPFVHFFSQHALEDGTSLIFQHLFRSNQQLDWCEREQLQRSCLKTMLYV